MKRVLFFSLLAMCCGLFWFATCTGIAMTTYFVACHEESLLKKGMSKEQAEDVLSLYRKGPTQRRWLIDTEKEFIEKRLSYHWVRYHILFCEPIDVMYDDRNKITAIVATYE